MRDCLKTVGGDEYAEDNISISENDATTGSDDNPENGIASLNEFGRDLWQEGSVENDEIEGEDVNRTATQRN